MSGKKTTKSAKAAPKKTTKPEAAPKREKKAKAPVVVPIEASAGDSLPFDASAVETTANTTSMEPTPVPEPEPTNAKAKKAKSRKVAAPAKPAAKLGVLSAAHHVLAASADPMTCAELIEAMAAQKLWSSPNGKTPAQTLYAAIIREIQHKGAEARFIKTERGKFEARKA